MPWQHFSPADAARSTGHRYFSLDLHIEAAIQTARVFYCTSLYFPLNTLLRRKASPIHRNAKGGMI